MSNPIPSAKMTKRRVHYDSVNPGLTFGVSPKALQRTIDVEIGILQHIADALSISQNPHRQTRTGPLSPLQDLLEAWLEVTNGLQRLWRGQRVSL